MGWQHQRSEFVFFHDNSLSCLYNDAGGKHTLTRWHSWQGFVNQARGINPSYSCCFCSFGFWLNNNYTFSSNTVRQKHWLYSAALSSNCHSLCLITFYSLNPSSVLPFSVSIAYTYLKCVVLKHFFVIPHLVKWENVMPKYVKLHFLLTVLGKTVREVSVLLAWRQSASFSGFKRCVCLMTITCF